jgi:hypothetical protein
LIDLETVAIRHVGPDAKGGAKKEILDQEIFDLYRKIGNLDSVSVLRREKIIEIPEERQLSIIFDRRFQGTKDSRGVGPVHDLAMFGTVRTQVEIVVNHRTFDRPRFMSEWGTPPDLVAILGRWEAQMKMVSILPRTNLVKPRLNGRTRLHDIAGSQASRRKLLMLLDQVPDLLGAISKNGESLARVIWNSGDKRVRRQLYDRLPLWNWLDNHPDNRKP